MHEMKRKGVAVVIGTGDCNAKCKHCGGLPLRKYAPKEDGIIDEELIYKTLKDSYDNSARYLSISSTGEPTLSPKAVTKVLELTKEKNLEFLASYIYSNGIRIGEDEEFCKEYLTKWKSLGLESIYITVHDIDEEKNAKVYGVKSYPPLETILSRIHDADLKIRANIVLNKEAVGTFEDFVYTVENLIDMGFDDIAAWPVRGLDDEVDYEKAPSDEELDKIEEWIKKYESSGHNVKLRRDERKKCTEPRKLTLFPDGTFSDCWSKDKNKSELKKEDKCILK